MQMLEALRMELGKVGMSVPELDEFIGSFEFESVWSDSNLKPTDEIDELWNGPHKWLVEETKNQAAMWLSNTSPDHPAIHDLRKKPESPVKKKRSRKK